MTIVIGMTNVSKLGVASRSPSTAESTENQPPQRLMQLVDLCEALAGGRGGWPPISTFHEDYKMHTEVFSGPIAELIHERKAVVRVAVERMGVIDDLRDELAKHSNHL